MKRSRRLVWAWVAFAAICVVAVTTAYFVQSEPLHSPGDPGATEVVGQRLLNIVWAHRLYQLQFVGLGIGVPLAVLLLGAIGRWIGNGLKKPREPRRIVSAYRLTETESSE